MTHGILKRWLIKSGDFAKFREGIYELEVDGLLYEVEPFVEGAIVITGIEGSTYKVDEIIGLIEYTAEQNS